MKTLLAIILAFSLSSCATPLVTKTTGKVVVSIKPLSPPVRVEITDDKIVVTTDPPNVIESALGGITRGLVGVFMDKEKK